MAGAARFTPIGRGCRRHRRLTVRDLAVGGARVDLTFQRIGERVVAYPEGGDPGAIPVISHA